MPIDPLSLVGVAAAMAAKSLKQKSLVRTTLHPCLVRHQVSQLLTSELILCI